MKVLVVVDVQKEFDKFIPHDLVDELYNYARKFKQVYQIWDTHKTDISPTYVFPNQVDSVKKKYGKNHFSDKVRKFINDKTDETFEGNLFKLSDNEGYIVRVDNNHDWFYVNPEIVELIEKLKKDQVILAGGADNECLEDVYQAFKTFGLNVHINKKYVYSAKTDQNDSIDDNIVNEGVLMYPYRFKTEKEMKDEYGNNWRNTAFDGCGWGNGCGLYMDYFLGKDYPYTEDKLEHCSIDSYPTVFDDNGKEWWVHVDMLIKNDKIKVPSYEPRKIDRTLFERIDIPNNLTREQIIKNIKNFKSDYLLIKVDGNYQKQKLLNILNDLNEKIDLFAIPDKFTNNNNETDNCYWVIPLKDDKKYKFLTLYSASYNAIISGNLTKIFGGSIVTITDMTYGDKIELVFSQIIGVKLNSYLMYAPKNITKNIDNRYGTVVKKDI